MDGAAPAEDGRPAAAAVNVEPLRRDDDDDLLPAIAVPEALEEGEVRADAARERRAAEARAARRASFLVSIVTLLLTSIFSTTLQYVNVRLRCCGVDLF